jgi:hypothetical protein
VAHPPRAAIRFFISSRQSPLSTSTCFCHQALICGNESAPSSYVYELVRYALEQQLRDALRLRARRARDDARPDDDDAQQRDDERQPRDGVLERDASELVPSWCFSTFNLTEFNTNWRIGFWFLSGP